MRKLIQFAVGMITVFVAGIVLAQGPVENQWAQPLAGQFTNQPFTVVNTIAGNSTLQYLTLKSDAACTCTVSMITCSDAATNTLPSLIVGGSTTNTYPVALNLPWQLGDKVVLTPNTAASVTNRYFAWVKDAR